MMNRNAFPDRNLYLLFALLCWPMTISGAQFFSSVTYCQGGGLTLRLNLATPNQKVGGAPGIILIHGGAWTGGDKSDLNSYAIALADQGFVAATVDYRLSSTYAIPKTSTSKYLTVGAPFPAALEDVKCAVRWLRANGLQFGMDQNKIVAFGLSAGAHLALLLGTTDSVSEFEGTGGFSGVSSSINSVVDWFGPTNLTAAYFATANTFSAQSIALLTSIGQFMAGTPLTVPSRYFFASPINYVRNSRTHFLVLHGTADTVVPINQSVQFVQKLQQYGNDITYHPFEGAQHGFSDPNTSSAAFRISVDFIKNRVR